MELASQISKNMIETLLNIHALTNMHRSSDVKEYRDSARNWIPNLEHQFNILKNELNKDIS